MAQKPLLDLLNGVTRFGKLTFLGEAERSPTMRRGLFRCDCGVTKPMGLHHIRAGKTVSCGCENARRASSRFTKHGAYRDRTYKSWSAMMQRCHNEASDSYPAYGGAGITVWADWHGPEGYHRFLAYVGPRPAGCSIDRIDNDKGYEPGNVRWATTKEQMNNRRRSRPLTYNGETMNAKDWALRLGMGRNTIYERLRAGWSVERALSEPAHMCGGRVA
ncbi:hypothetical protein [Sphingomonas sp. 1P08PE]|uniref:hypothetical protein n=1 Tax=Sphingomonas sp. 1P08PE TaxID=554122 RepID=UPI0039A22397